MKRQITKNEGNGIRRRAFLRRTVAGTTGLAIGALGGSEEAKAAAASESPAPLPGGYDTQAPSNALVTGIDPDEFVLFAFDDHWIPLRYNLDLKLQQPVPYEKNPVLRLGGEGEPDCFFASLFGTVFRLDGKFRMWYGAVDSGEVYDKKQNNMRLAYAESDDGIHWVKPKLGLRKYNGNTANNLCGLDYSGGCYCFEVLYEPDEPDPNRRFKMAYTGYNNMGIRRPMLRVAYSADGLRWTEHPKNPVVRDTWVELSGIHRWGGVYYANGQTGWPSPPLHKRTMVTFASPDMHTWQQTYVVSFHRHDRQVKPGFYLGRQAHLGASIWHRRNVLLGLYGQWDGGDRQIHKKKLIPDIRCGLGLVISNDGLLFREPVPDFPLIPWGEEKSDWKTLRLFQTAPVNHGDKTYFWYGAASGKESQVENRSMVGLATLPRDRFGYLRPRGSGATWCSNILPAMPGGARVAINADGLSDEAQIRVEALDHQFRPIPGFSGAQAAMVTGGGLREPIAWAGGTQTAPAKQPWRLQLHFQGSAAKKIRFYALYIKSSETS